MSKKFCVQEWRTLDWIVEVPDTVTKENIEHCRLKAEHFVEDWTDIGNTEHAYLTAHEVPPEAFDDNAADVVLNQFLEVVEDAVGKDGYGCEEVNNG